MVGRDASLGAGRRLIPLMRIRIVAVGRGKRDPTAPLFERYVERLPWPIEVKEVEARGRSNAGERRDRERRLIGDAWPDGGLAIALDRRGESLTSEDFAARLREWRNRAVPEIVFLVGGADGLGDAVLKRADAVVSFGAMTWPHMLARVMLAEQLYRASTIHSGHPYHRSR